MITYCCFETRSNGKTDTVEPWTLTISHVEQIRHDHNIKEIFALEPQGMTTGSYFSILLLMREFVFLLVARNFLKPFPKCQTECKIGLISLRCGWKWWGMYVVFFLGETFKEIRCRVKY